MKAGHLGGHDQRHTDGAEGHGGGVGDQGDTGAPQRGEAQAHQHGGGDGHGGAETGGAFDEAGEGEGDEQGLQTTVVRQAGQGVFDDLELTGFHGHVVDPHGRDDDPDDGEQAEAGPQCHGVDCQAYRHFPDQDGHQQGAHQTGHGGDMTFRLPESQHVEQNDQRYGCRQCRQADASQRFVNLSPSHLSLPSTRKACRRSVRPLPEDRRHKYILNAKIMLAMMKMQ